MPFFNHDGLRFHFDMAGEGTPILLIHGFASSLVKNWRETGWVDALTRAGHQVIALDNRGHGESDKLYDPARYDTDVMAKDAIALLDYLGINRAHYFGYSMGAIIGLRALALAPDRFNSMIVAGIGVNATKFQPALTKIAHAMRAEDPKSLTDPLEVTFRTFADSQPNDLLALAACAERGRTPAQAQHYADRQILPVLVVGGEQDELAQGLDQLAAIIPGAVSATIPRRNHMTAVGDKETKRVVLEFLAGI